MNSETAHFAFGVEIVVDSDLLARSAPVTGYVDYFERSLAGDGSNKVSKFGTHGHLPEGVERGAGVGTFSIYQRVLVLLIKVSSCQPPRQAFYVTRESLREVSVKDLRYKNVPVRLCAVEPIT
jgi:hypothetical protein